MKFPFNIIITILYNESLVKTETLLITNISDLAMAIELITEDTVFSLRKITDGVLGEETIVHLYTIKKKNKIVVFTKPI